MRQSDITYIEKINELRLDISHPNSRGHVFIFVEGDSDVRIFRNLFKDEVCNVERIPGGNSKLQECLVDLQDRSDYLMSIRDADFLYVLNLIPENTNIHLTDFHDIEITILSIKEIELAILNEFTNIPKESYNNFIDRIFNILKPISVVKFLNQRYDFRMKFKFGFLHLLDQEDSINIEEFINLSIQSAGNNCKTSPSAFLQLYNDVITDEYDMKQITNGHDFVRVLAHILRNEHGHTGLQERTIESALRVLFSMENFSTTNLYSKLTDWSTIKGVEIFK